MLNNIIKFFLKQRLIAILLMAGLIFAGLATAPFSWELGSFPRSRVAVDAIPDLGENQQIIFTEWAGHSPEDIDDQITYPLTSYLLGVPGVKSVRASSIFGFSSIYLLFEEDVEFYWSRSRILEKLNALPPDLLPEEVQPKLGPDATALGQVFWYTLEGRDTAGQVTGGWDLQEIRSIQDFYVKYALNAVPGVSEVASIGGFVQEYQIDLEPATLKAYDISLTEVARAVQRANQDIGAKTLEINRVEYLVRGLGRIENLEDLRRTVIKSVDNVPITLQEVAEVKLGPAERRGALDKEGAEVVGGVVVARDGANPMAVIESIKAKIREIEPGLPKKTLADGRESQLKVIPFYDRSGLINETLGTLEEALKLEILISILVVIVMVYHLRAALLISSLLPISVLIVFIAMRFFGIDANIVALSGIAIAIGTMIDLGIILSENVLKAIEERAPDQTIKEMVYQGASEVSGALLTAVTTTVISFIPVFSLEAAEGKLFIPLAYTKTFALIAALLVSLLFLPTLATWFLRDRSTEGKWKHLLRILLICSGLLALFKGIIAPGVFLILFPIWQYWQETPSSENSRFKGLAWLQKRGGLALGVLTVIWLLGKYWLPLGPAVGLLVNALFVALLVGSILLFFLALEHYYRPILRWCLRHRKTFISMPILLVLFALFTWQGYHQLMQPLYHLWEDGTAEPKDWQINQFMGQVFPGLGEEFMPSLDEGSFLLMPTSMPHAGIEENRETLAQLDILVSQIPEVETVVGKLGRVESALDPAPISMYENVIQYKPEYVLDQDGRPRRFRVDEEEGFILKSGDTLSHSALIGSDKVPDQLLPDDEGLYFRNWRSEIQSTDDIWTEIQKVSQLPGVTSAPKLQPIETRLVMLQTGMRAPMGIKVFGPDLQTIQDFSFQLETLLKQVPDVKSEAVFADRIVGKPYLEVKLDRSAMARYGLSVDQVQAHLKGAVGGMTVGTTIEGRERYAIQVRYPRELRSDPTDLQGIFIKAPDGSDLTLGQVADITFKRGPQAIKSEETFLVGYVLFDKAEGVSEIEAVEAAQNHLQSAIEKGQLNVPAGVNYRFSGSYENQQRASKRLAWIIPVVMLVIFLILYLQFRSVATALMVFSGVLVAFSGGFLMLWFYGQGWFMNFGLADISLREFFQIQEINLSVAVWVGFIALFGIATDDGVLMATYLDQRYAAAPPKNEKERVQATIEAGARRIRPAVMTSATTLIALLPILSSQGKGSDIMIPMAIPAFGGMVVAALSYFMVPLLYHWRAEHQSRKANKNSSAL